MDHLVRCFPSLTSQALDSVTNIVQRGAQAQTHTWKVEAVPSDYLCLNGELRVQGQLWLHEILFQK